MQRPDISKLRKNRPIYLKLGFIGALSMLLLAFNWTTDFAQPDDGPIETAVLEDVFQVIRTADRPKPVLPPPVVETITEPIFDDPEFDPEPEPEPVPDIGQPEPDIDREPVPEPIVRAAPPKPVLPEPEPKEVPAEIFEVVEEMPRFPGCELAEYSKAERQACAEKKMLEFMYKNIRYPEIARQNGIGGTTVIRFVIEPDGTISNHEIVRDPGGKCGAEALRVVKLMPSWLPGKQRGRAVRVQYNLPIRYTLQ